MFPTIVERCRYFFDIAMLGSPVKVSSVLSMLSIWGEALKKAVILCNELNIHLDDLLRPITTCFQSISAGSEMIDEVHVGPTDSATDGAEDSRRVDRSFERCCAPSTVYSML